MSGWDAVQATDAALLPTLVAQQAWLRAGWAVILAWLVLVALQSRWPGAWRDGRKCAVVALFVGLWALVPGTLSPAHWLGLAFQAPSVLTVLLCLGGLVRCWRAVAPRSAQDPLADRMDSTSLALSALAVVLGWALLLDSFALLPVWLYAWGFGPAAVGAVALLALLVVALWPARGGPAVWHAALVPLALLLLVALRLPTGNVWDAVLDPCLWLVLQAGLVRWGISRYKNRS